MPPSSTRAALVALSFLLAYLTYFYIERRVRAGRERITFVLAGLMAALFAFGIATQAELLRPRNDSRSIGLMLEAIHDWEYPSSLEKTTFQGTPVRSKKAGEKTVLYVGDSHLEQYAARIVSLLEQGSTSYPSVVFLTSPGCSPIPGSAQVNSYHIERCATFRQDLARLAVDPEVDSVVVAGAWNLYFLESRTHYAGSIDVESEIAGIDTFLRTLTRHKKVYFVLDNPSGQQFEPRNFFAGSRLSALTVKPFQEQVALAEDQAALRARLAQVAATAGGGGDRSRYPPLSGRPLPRRYRCRQAHLQGRQSLPGFLRPRACRLHGCHPGRLTGTAFVSSASSRGWRILRIARQ
jgi:hypothetical protein